MDDQRFDRITRLIVAGPASRRRLLGAMVAGVGSAAGATRRHAAASDGDCPATADHFSNTSCSAISCNGRPDCSRTLTVSGARQCTDLLEFDGSPYVCPKRDECDRDRDCRRGWVCAKVGGCCDHPRRNTCLRLCAG